jgi:hypothetical protein
VLPALLVLLAGSGYVFGLAWAHLRAQEAPPPLAVGAVLVVVGALAFSQAATVALDPARPPEWWRPAVAALVVAAGAVLVLLAPVHTAWSLLPAGGLAALAARAGETVGAHLASAVQLPRDDAVGDWSRQAPETRRIVLETWALAAAAAAFAVQGTGLTAGLGLVALGGLALAAGSHVQALRRLAASEGFLWEWADAAAALRGAALLIAVVLAVALAVPAVPALVPRGIPDAIRLLLHLLFRHGQRVPAPRRAAPQATGPAAHAGLGIPLPGAFAGEGGVSPGFMRFFAVDIQGWLFLLVGMAVLAVALVQYLRFARDIGGDWLEPLRRLWAALWGFLAFWRWMEVRSPGGQGRRAPAPGALAAASAPGAVEAPLGLLDPRRAVRASYRRLLRQAAASGLSREPGDTPARFAAVLAPAAGEAAADVADLTRTYEEARYSHHPVPRRVVPVVRAALDRILHVLVRRGPRSTPR